MYKKTIPILLSAILVWSGLVSSATAAVIATGDALAIETREAQVTSVQQLMAQGAVRGALINLGVDPAQAEFRVASLSNRELAELQNHLEELPAGGILGLIGAVFVILLILELTGVIDIFKKV